MIYKILIVFFLLAACIWPTANASEIDVDHPCPNVLIDYKKFPGVKSEKEMSRNQDSTGWCISFARADMLCYHYNRESNWTLKDQCSAADYRAQFAGTDDSIYETAKYGNYGNSTKVYDGQGLCPESVFPSEYWNNNQIQTLDLYKKIDDMAKKIQAEGRASVEGQCPECAAISPKTSWNNVMDHLAKEKDGKAFLQKVNEAVCKDKRIGKGIKVEFDDTYARGRIRNAIDEIMAQIKKENPVSVGFESSLLNPNIKGGHALLTIGSTEIPDKYGNQICHMVLKNSWGGCDYIVNNRDIKCDPKTGLIYMDQSLYMAQAGGANWIRTRPLALEKKEDLLFSQARAAIGGYKYAEAIASFQQAALLKVKLPETFYYFFGRAYAGDTQWVNARTAYEKYLQQTGTQGQYYKEALASIDRATSNIEEIKRLAEMEWADSDNGADTTWNEAKNYCASKGSGWRLPAIAELKLQYQHGKEAVCFRWQDADIHCRVASKSRLTGELFWSNESEGPSKTRVVSLRTGKVGFAFADAGPVDGFRALCVRRP
jgi:hypothetical protein